MTRDKAKRVIDLCGKNSPFTIYLYDWELSDRVSKIEVDQTKEENYPYSIDDPTSEVFFSWWEAHKFFLKRNIRKPVVKTIQACDLVIDDLLFLVGRER